MEKKKWILIEPSLLLRIEWTSDKLIHSLHALFNKKRLCHSQRRKIRKDKNCTSNIQSIEHFKNTPILYKNTSVLAYTVCDCYRCSTNHAINFLVINIQFMCIIINSNSCWGQGVTSFVTRGLTRVFSLVHGIRTLCIRYSQIISFIWPRRILEGQTICLKNTVGMGLNDVIFLANLSILENQEVFQIFCCSVSL